MRKYKSAVYKHLHEEFKDMFEDGDISADELKEFEQRCFKLETTQGRAVQAKAIAVSSPGQQG
ncbi:XRE family transcriptional regulator [Breznakiellaceae bacterium SP9]